ncbi:hypothetical protein ACFVIM_00435 [Streptomyces sp. NPDC057638]|uniref:hypothetical protein n=1 Tax=Streptomyces sp. NPDC057638 TaxID=3346190 RepID=UPI0036C603B4
MPKDNSPLVITPPEHHLAAMALIIITRAPGNDALEAALRLAEHAAIASWALRPHDLASLTVEQYQQLLDHTAAPCVLDFALYLGGDRRRIRNLMDFIAELIAELIAHYPPPPRLG